MAKNQNQNRAQAGKVFRVAAVSSNRNSFGLTGVVLIARDGSAVEVGHCQDPVTINRGDFVEFPVQEKRVASFGGGLLRTAAKGPGGIRVTFEIPRDLPKAPKAVVAEVWA
jgi:hypothetical protein